MKLTEKRFFRFAAVVLFCAAASSLFADEAAERALGDTAFYSGDYRNAAAFYESAMILSDSAGNGEAWADNALKLGCARFYDGDLEGTGKILAELRRRHPGRSAGTLPGDLLAASGKTEAAEKFYRTLITSGDPETVAAAEMSRGYLRLKNGDFEGAKRCFENVAQNKTPWAKNGRLAVIYTLIRQNKLSNAMAELGRVPPVDQGEQWQLLRWLTDLRSGRLQEVEKPLLQYVARQPARPQPRLFEILLNAARLAAREKQPEKAADFYEKALNYCPDSASRQEVFRRLINLYSVSDLTRAKECAQSYAGYFPDAPDRALIQISVGKLLAQNKREKEALAFFRQAISDQRLPLTERLSAAEAGVIAAEKINQREDAEYFYQLLIAESPGAASRLQWRSAYVRYLLRINELARAVKAVENALVSADKNEKESLLMLQLEILRRSGNTEELRKTVQLLLRSGNPSRVAMARAVWAEAQEKKGDFAGARKSYLEAAASGGKLEQSSRFKAAQMAMQCEEMESAAEEFTGFARRYPKAESTPAALYYAICAFRQLGSPQKAEEIQRQLKELHPRSKARIATEMLSSESRAENGDAAGAAADLGRMLAELQGHPDLADAMVMQMRCFQLAGEPEKALKAAEDIQRLYPGSAASAEALLAAGNIEFNRGSYDKAIRHFLLAEKTGKNQLFKEVVSGRIVDTELVLYGSSDPAKLADTQMRCRQLFTTSNNPLIRLQSRYKSGMAKERSGDKTGAVSAYEQLLYDAGGFRKRNLPVSTEWCVRAANAALRLIVQLKEPDALQRGNRLIDHYEALSLPDSGENFTQLRREFRKKILQKTPRR